MQIRDRKAVEPIIATLLIVAVAVVGGVVTFTWVTGTSANLTGTALPGVESLQLLGHDARDVADLTSFDILDNTTDQKLVGDGSNGEFIVLQVRNTGANNMIISEVLIMGVSHMWDSSANLSTAPTNGKFEMYQKVNGAPTTDKTEPRIAPGEDARFAIRLGDLPSDQIQLSVNLQVKVKTTQPTTFNFIVPIGSANGASASSSGSGSQSQTSCNSLSATITGTEGNDVISGTANNDVIVGLGGNDVINGSAGNDTICGGDGNDVIDASSGDDVIYGGDGNDTINGSSGDDVIYGEGGNDVIDGSSGTDTIDGGPGTDVCTGGETVSNCP